MHLCDATPTYTRCLSIFIYIFFYKCWSAVELITLIFQLQYVPNPNCNSRGPAVASSSFFLYFSCFQATVIFLKRIFLVLFLLRIGETSMHTNG